MKYITAEAGEDKLEQAEEIEDEGKQASFPCSWAVFTENGLQDRSGDSSGSNAHGSCRDGFDSLMVGTWGRHLPLGRHQWHLMRSNLASGDRTRAVHSRSILST